MPGVAAIVLAAGASSRMGTPKQLLQLKGKSLVRRAVETVIGAGCERVIVVAGAQAVAIGDDLAEFTRDQNALGKDGSLVEIAINSGWERGIGSSIRTGADRLLKIAPRPAAIVLLLCDQPFITSDAIGRLIDALDASGKPVVVSSFMGTVGPPVVIRADFFSKLENLPDDHGAKFIWMDEPDSVFAVACDEAAFDVDTPGDFERARKNFSRDADSE
jgi:molybdenum cofactor cytidylyltransferase